MVVRRTGDQRIDGLFTGYVWASSVVTWSDPRSGVLYGTGYPGDFDGDGIPANQEGFSRLSAGQRATAALALDSTLLGPSRAGFTVEGFTNLTTTYVAGGSGAANIRIANTSDAPTAYAFYPGAGAGGDVWLGDLGRAPRAGNADHLTILHEIGHALGLKHSHETSVFGAVPLGWDTPEFTVMTYRPWAGAAAVGGRFETWGAPQTYMMLDIAALQELYGADYTINAGNTVYGWAPGSGITLVNGAIAINPGGNRIFATIWDGGGRDTYDLSDYATGVKVDLRPGLYSTFSTAQLADLGGGPNDGYARGNVFNALQHDGDARSLIENAIGGTGSDQLTGNAAANALFGGIGADRLSGLGGADALVGGPGPDTFVFLTTADTPFGAGDRLAPSGAGIAFDAPGAAAGDLLLLGQIDADVLVAGNQTFVFGGAGRGHLWLSERGTATVVFANTDGDPAPELQITIEDGAVRWTAYSADDFVL